MIGKSITAIALLLGTLAVPLHSFADDVKFTAELDHDEISLDDSVTLKFAIQTDAGSVGDVTYQAKVPAGSECARASRSIKS
jgi:hypothetical protein